MRRLRYIILLLLFWTFEANGDDETSYYLLAVSGTLQDGYTLRKNLDYFSKDGEITTRAILLGKAFVRGYKSYLDVMEPDYRQYVPHGKEEEESLTVNPNTFATGCHEHANEYYAYLVDSRQVFSILMGEPRFLSITPDTGLVELKHSSPLVQAISRHEILSSPGDQKTKNMHKIAIPLVTAVWFQSTSLVESPVVKEIDGAQVTNFEESLASWSGADDADRLEYIEAYENCLNLNSNEENDDHECDITKSESYKRYWTAIREAIRKEEAERITSGKKKEQILHSPPDWKCKNYVRFGTSKSMTRMNYSFTAEKIQEIVGGVKNENGKKYKIDFVKGKVLTLSNNDNDTCAGAPE